MSEWLAPSLAIAIVLIASAAMNLLCFYAGVKLGKGEPVLVRDSSPIEVVEPEEPREVADLKYVDEMNEKLFPVE